MLKPYVCAACEKVIFSQDLVASLISLFGKIVINVPADAPEIPKNAVVPKEWAVFSSWDTEPGDELREYSLCTQLVYPDQTPFGEISRLRVPVERGKRAQISVQMVAFPIGQTGLYTVRTWIEGDQSTVPAPIEFKIELEITRQKPTQ